MSLTWAQRTTYKKKQSDTRQHLFRTLLSPSTSLINKILIYKTVLPAPPPRWAYDIQIRGRAKSSNTRPIEAFRSNMSWTNNWESRGI